jgi:starch synthase
MRKAKILYVSQEIFPFLPKSEISEISRNLPQSINEKGREVRVFMPRFGVINERRHQLHEVIRLSGMNLVINDMDHPLIIKVASIPTARMQVYFIDNEDYFQRKNVFANDKNKFFEDNDERSMFFCKGVLETVKKLGWAPDIIHCHGWMTALLPMYIKKLHNEDPHFSEAKLIYSAYNNSEKELLNEKFAKKLEMDGFSKKDLKKIVEPNILNLNKLAVEYADGIIEGSEELHKDLKKCIADSGKATLNFQSPDNYVKAYTEFYTSILEDAPVLVN